MAGSITPTASNNEPLKTFEMILVKTQIARVYVCKMSVKDHFIWKASAVY